jgi:hypothetical protein
MQEESNRSEDRRTEYVEQPERKYIPCCPKPYSEARLDVEAAYFEARRQNPSTILYRLKNTHEAQ